MRTKINRFLSGDLCLWILSLLLSTVLWMIIINTNDPATTRTFSNVEVTVVNQQVLTDQGKTYIITSGDTVKFSIRGKKSIVDKMKKTDFDVIADLSELSSVNSVPIKVTAKKYANNLEIVYDNDEVLTVTIDDLMSKSFDVVANLSGTPANGYSVGEITMSPKTIKIEGPESEVSEISAVKVNVDVSNAMKSVSQKVAPLCYNKSGKKMSTDHLSFSKSNIKVKVAIGASKTVPIEVSTTGSPASGYQIASVECTPSKIKVTGTSTAMDSISSIKLEDVNVKDATENITKEVKASSLSLPEGITLLDSSIEIKVKVVINQVAEDGSVKLSSGDIQINGQSQNMKVSFVDKSTSFSIQGDKDIIDSVSASDFHPSINVSGLSEGNHTVTVSLDDVSGITVKDSPQIKIKIIIDTSDTDDDTND